MDQAVFVEALPQNYPSPEDENRFKTAPISRASSPLTPIEDVERLEEESDVAGVEDEDETFELDADEMGERAEEIIHAVKDRVSRAKYTPTGRTRASRSAKVEESPEDHAVSPIFPTSRSTGVD